MIAARTAAFAALIFGHAPFGPGARPVRDSLRARELTRAGLEQEAALNLDSALALYRSARRADSTDAVAEFRYIALRRERTEYAVLHDEYAPSLARGTVRASWCWTPLVASLIDVREVDDQLFAAAQQAEATPCAMAVTTLIMRNPDVATRATRLDMDERATRAFPGIAELWMSYAMHLREGGDTAGAQAAWRRGERAVDNPVLRMKVGMYHAAALLQDGDSAGARALQASLEAAALRDGRPGVMAMYLDRALTSPGLSDNAGGPRRVLARLLALCRTPGSWAIAAEALSGEGKRLVDGGQPLEALPLLSRAVAIADSVRVGDLQLAVRTLRGRAYTKAGRPEDAERDLLKALATGKSAVRQWYRADAWHNLAHAYESEGRWADAMRAIDTYTALTLRMQGGPEVTALLDAAEIRWEAGWHASADVAFRRMVRAIDSTHGNYYFAGEYYERSGNLERARDYYERAVEEVGANPAGFAGMARVHAALGHADSAETWARAHDAMIVHWQPLDVPMLPPTLAANGRIGEATRIAHAWAARQIAGGNVEGAALATLQVARLLLDAGHADSALVETQRIDSIVNTLNLPREAIRARVIRGTALVRLGESDAGVRTLDSALATAERHPSPDILVEAHEALGEAFAATGRDDSALHEFDLAALAVEHSTLDLTLDLDRAGYRDRNLRPYDGALRLLLHASSRPGATDELVRWLSRRNAAALALGASGTAAARSRGPSAPGLDDLRSRLRDDEVLLAYVVLDSTVSGVAVTRSGARAARLPIDAAGLAARIDAIRRPLVTTYSGRLDLARAHYATRPAAELYAALIEPFAREIAGKHRLLIAPDGALHALSFDGLVAPDSAYLIDAFETEYLPSPAFLPAPAERLRAQRLDGMRLLAVGYGAPGSEAEVRALRDVWPHARTVTLDSSSATTSAVKARMTAFGILHFAVHATADTHDPLVSHLTLVADSLDDGFFHTADIAAIRTNAALVVLSACETDAGPIYGGEGAMGIARAFLAGGAHAVVATQWPVGAETATLMREFYTRLARGEAPATALRAAKLMVRRSAGGGHPVYWAGFELVR